jgi:3-hydroxymyristoyl/3-hydroxydecanoyl-(acyl carrier protein) dehydratase
MTNFIDIERSLDNTNSLISAQVQVPEDAIWFDGHFPDMAVLPGIAQIGMIVELLEKTMNKPVRVLEVNRVRFKQAIEPGNPIEIQVSSKENMPQTFAFRLFKNGKLACSGFIKVVLETPGSGKK